MAGEDDSERKQAILGLWCLQGIGHAAIEAIGDVYPDLTVLLDARGPEWVGAVGLSDAQAHQLLAWPGTLRELAHHALHRANAAAMRICHLGEPGYPRGLADLAHPPPLLFYWGRGDRANAPRRLAMVGSRQLEVNYHRPIVDFALGLARHVIVVSGGAVGVDQLCHRAAIAAGGETWAFMGAGLDELDASQRALAPEVVDSGGTVFSPFPPGTRPDKSNFPRRNRFIAGSSDAVFVLRAGIPSGALGTAEHAMRQGKPLFTMPGQTNHETSRGPNFLLRKRMARIATCADDVLLDMGVTTAVSPPIALHAPAVDVTTLSPEGQAAYAALTSIAVDFDTLLPLAAPLTSGQLSSALVELELSGLLRQQPGRRFQRA